MFREKQAWSVTKLIDRMTYEEDDIALLLSNINGVIFLDCIDRE